MEADYVFMTTRLVPQEITKGVLPVEMKMQDSNSKLYEEIKISVNTKTIIKASIIVTVICDSTFCFLHDLRN